MDRRIVSLVPQVWGEMPDTLDIQQGEVHVYRLGLEPSQKTEKALRRILSPEETLRADRFIRPVHRTRFAVGRGVLRHLLGLYCEVAPADIEFTYGEFGKPSLSNTSSGIEFNVSNTKALGVVAITANRPVGVDIEQHRERLELEKLARRYFSPDEVTALFDVEPEQRAEAFYRCWSSKEAFMKVCGKGLSLGLSRFNVEVDLEKPPGVLGVPEGMGNIDQWDVVSLPMGDDVAGILALEGRLEMVRLIELKPESLL